MPDNAIWAVTGPEHDARMARELAWIATGGQTGIVGPDSCEVRAQNTPNNTVRIMPGGVSITATSERGNIGYTSAPWQAYMRSIYEPLTVEIDSTGSSGGRTDVVGIVVDDPEFEGTSPDPDEHQYWRPHVVRNAGQNATRPEHFASLGRPFLPLAQVRIPSSTATITNSMITDLRFLAVSRSESHDLLDVANAGSSSHIVIPSSQSNWQYIHTIENVPVPRWATLAKVHVMLGPVYTRGGAANGEFRLRNEGLGSGFWHTQPSAFVEPDHTEQTGGSPRFYLHTAGNFSIARSNQGGTATLGLQVRRTGSRPGEFVIPSPDHFICRVVGRVTFEESARRSDDS